MAELAAWLLVLEVHSLSHKKTTLEAALMQTRRVTDYRLLLPLPQASHCSARCCLRAQRAERADQAWSLQVVLLLLLRERGVASASQEAHQALQQQQK